VNWQVALRLGRVSNLPTVWTNVLTATVLAGGVGVPTPVWFALVALSLFYVGGMYLNDAFDRDIDRRERPERPIPSRQVAAPTVLAAGFGMLFAALALLLWAGYGLDSGTGWRAPVAGLALAAAIVFYDWYHKLNPWSPVVMGLCRVLVYITAGLTVATLLPVALLAAAAVLLCYLIGLTYMAKQESLNRIGSLWPSLFLLAPFVYTAPTALSGAFGFLIYAGFMLWVAFAASFLASRKRLNVPRAVASLLAGICLLDALLIAGHGQSALAGLALGGFGLTLVLQRFVPAT
jgi:hypothetical protein